MFIMAAEIPVPLPQSVTENVTRDPEIQKLGKALRSDCVDLLSKYGKFHGKRGISETSERIRNISLSFGHMLNYTRFAFFAGLDNTSINVAVSSDKKRMVLKPDLPSGGLGWFYDDKAVKALTIISLGEAKPKDTELILFDWLEKRNFGRLGFAKNYLKIDRQGGVSRLRGKLSLTGNYEFFPIEDRYPDESVGGQGSIKTELIKFTHMINRVKQNLPRTS